MPLRWNKRVRVAPGVNLNLSKRGVGVSAGGRGLRVSRGGRGTRVSTGIPGTGISYSKQIAPARRGCLARLFGR